MPYLVQPYRFAHRLLALVLLACTGMSHAQDAGRRPAGIDTPPADLIRGRPAPLTPSATPPQQTAPLQQKATTQQRYAISLQAMGADYPFNLRGVDGSDTVRFNVRLDELVTSARLNLTYAYSPGLLSNLSHINVLVNDQVAQSIPVNSETAGQSQQRQIDIPTYLITSDNRLRLQLVGHYTLECEDPLNSTLWANISNQSVLELTADRLRLPNDLSLLPKPFFDPMDSRPVSVPIVIGQERDAASLEAAGIVASWLGTLSQGQGIQFPVTLGQSYPARGHAIVITREGPGSTAADTRRSGASISIRENPNDPYGKLLVVSGRTDNELKNAAQALATGQITLAGERANVQDTVQLTPRAPYDAPYWLPTDRPFRLGDWFDAQQLATTGYAPPPVKLPLRLPPDLFAWREPAVPLNLNFRYTPQPGKTQSTLLINGDGEFMNSVPLLSVDYLRDSPLPSVLRRTDEQPVSAALSLPLERLLNLDTLDFQFVFDYQKQGECLDALSDNVRGTIDPDTTLDLRGYPHFMVMPNLSAFQRSGFPFTRLADLSETTVVLSQQPTAQDIQTYLTLMARFSGSTGYPATQVKVALGPNGLLSTDDLLVIATGANTWLSSWISEQDSPLNVFQQRFATSDMIRALSQWVPADARERASPANAQLELQQNGQVALITGFESPNLAGRSVVVIAATSTTAQQQVSQVLVSGDSQGERLAGSAAVLNEGRLTPLVSEYSYHTGELPMLRYLEWLIAPYWRNAPSLHTLTAFGLFFVLVLSWLAYRGLRRARLRSDTSSKD